MIAKASHSLITLIRSLSIAELRAKMRQFPDFCILTYHSIEPEMLYTPISVPVLRDHLSFLKKHYELISVAELVRRLVAGSVGKRTAVVTFDDGYANAALSVLPVLRSLEVPATFFVSTYHCTSGRYLWNSMLWAFREFYSQDRLDVWGRTWPTRTRNERDELGRIMARRFQHTGYAELGAFLEQTLPPFESFVPEPGRKHYLAGMNAEQLRELANCEYAGLGAHTVNHLLLERCTLNIKKRECSESIEFLQSSTGKEISCFAYPMGSYDKETIDVLRSLNIRAAFTTRSFFGPDRLYEIPRVMIGSPSLFWLDMRNRRFGTVNKLLKTAFYQLTKSGGL